MKSINIARKAIFVMLVALIAPISFTAVAGAKQKKTANVEPQQIQKQNTYLEDPFVTNGDSLQANFMGNDVEKVVDSLIKRTSSNKKGEFETTAQYQERTKNTSKEFIYGHLTLDSVFAFTVKPSLKYDADSGVFTLTLRSSRGIYTTSGGTDEYDANVSRILSGNSRSEYKSNKTSIQIKSSRSEKVGVGQNAYGATTEIKISNVIAYDIAAYNALNFFKSGRYDFSPELMYSFRLPVEEAQLAKDFISFVFVVTLNEPYYSKGFMHIDAKRDRPEETNMVLHYIHVNIKEILVCNMKTGVIYGKI